MGTKNVMIWILLFVVPISGVLSYSQVGHLINYKVSAQSEAKSNESIINNTNQNAVLGDLIYEASGKIVGQRVVDTEASNGDLGKIEVSYSGRGYIKGIGNISETWTFENTHLPNSVSQGVGYGIIIPNDGNGVTEATELGRGFS